MSFFFNLDLFYTRAFLFQILIAKITNTKNKKVFYSLIKGWNESKNDDNIYFNKKFANSVDLQEKDIVHFDVVDANTLNTLSKVFFKTTPEDYVKMVKPTSFILYAKNKLCFSCIGFIYIYSGHFSFLSKLSKHNLLNHAIRKIWGNLQSSFSLDFYEGSA